MKNTLIYFVALVLATTAVFRIAGAMLIYEDAQVVIDKNMCGIVMGQIKRDVCVANADISRDFSGATLLKLKDGRVITLNHMPDGILYSKSRYRFFKNWI